MKTIATMFLIIVICKNSNANDDATTLLMLKSARAQHAASWNSGRMRFISKADHPGHQCVDVSGELEWSEDFSYFRGERNETHESGLSAGVIKRSIQVLRANGEVASLIHQSRLGHQSSDMFYLFPDDGSRYDDGVTALMPRYEWFMFSLSPLEKDGFESIVRPDGVSENGDVIRTIVGNGNKVAIRSFLKKSDREHNLVFGLDAGGMCESMKSRRHVKDGMKFVDVTRTWRQLQNGRWFPDKSEQIARIDSESATPYFHYTLTISECEPLDRPSVSATPSMTVFGNLPDGVLVGTRGANGKMVFDDISAARPPEFEDQLRQQADKIRGTGFSATGAK